MIDHRNESASAHSRFSVVRVLFAVSTFAAALLGSAEGQAQSGWVTGSSLDGVIGGYESNGTPLLICRSADPAYPGNHPGKRQASWNSCSVPFGDIERFTSQYQTLTPGWADATPYGGTSFGSEGIPATLGLCRGIFQGVPGVRIGKHIRSVNACAIGYGGAERWTTNYADLTEANFGIAVIPGMSNIALVAGWDGNLNRLYACVGTAPGVPGEHPGELYNGACHFGYGGQERVTTTYKTLVPLYRDDTREGPSGLPIVVAGTDADGSQLGICKRAVRGVQTGKYRFADRTCHISLSGREDVFTTGFDVLRRR